MKLWAKIKSIFKVFIAKFDSIFMKSSKEFIKKYKKDVLNKDLADVTVNYSKPTGVQFIISQALNVSLSNDELQKNIINKIPEFLCINTLDDGTPDINIVFV